MCTKKYQDFRNQDRKELCIAETAYWEDQLNKANTNKDFWKLVDKVKRKQTDCRTGLLKDGQGNLMIDDKQKAETMNSYFTTISQTLADHMESNTNINHVEYTVRVTPTCQQLEMDEKHFNQQFQDLKPEKATGHDNITLKALILADEAVKPGTKSIIRKSITDKKFPSDYEVARMKIIFKKGGKTDTRNYRPVSILGIVSKFLEGQVCKIIDAYLENNEILNENQ